MIGRLHNRNLSMKVAGKKFGFIRVFPICPILELMDQMLVANLLEFISIVNDCKKRWQIKAGHNTLSIKIFNNLVFLFFFLLLDKIIYPKYSKHWPYTVAHTIDFMCSKMLDHGWNHGFFLSLFKLISFPIHWIVYVLSYLNFIFEF